MWNVLAPNIFLEIDVMMFVNHAFCYGCKLKRSVEIPCFSTFNNYYVKCMFPFSWDVRCDVHEWKHMHSMTMLSGLTEVLSVHCVEIFLSHSYTRREILFIVCHLDVEIKVDIRVLFICLNMVFVCQHWFHCAVI